MSGPLQFRVEPLAEPRRPPSLDRGPVPSSAVIWRPELAPGGSLVRGVVVEVVEDEIVAESLVHVDEIGALEEAADYARHHRAAVVSGGRPRIGILDEAQAGKRLRSRSDDSGWALVVEHVGPDMCSLAVTAEFSRGGRVTAHLAGLVGPDGKVWPTEPRVVLSILGNGVLARWGSSKRSTLPDGRLEDPSRHGPVVGLLTLAAALSGTEPAGLDLAHACALWGVEVRKPADDHPLSTLRAEAHAMAALYLALAAELRRLRLPLNPGHVLSPGGIASVTLAATGLPRLTGRFDLPDRLRGAAASAYHGGWHAARVVGPAVSALLADLGHAHLRSAIALGATSYVVARKVVPVEKTAALQRLLRSPKLADLALDPDVRRRWGVTLVLVRPRGEPWPYQVAGKFTVGPLDLGGGLLWVHWQDALNAAQLSGRVPEVVEAWYLRPIGKVRSLRPVRLPSGRVLDLGAGEDLFEALVEERYAVAEDEGLEETMRARRVAFAKALALMAYGLLARVDREHVGGKTADQAIDFDGRRVKHRSGWREVPGPWTWLPLAGAITASTRLTIGATMAGLAEEGGDWLHVAADSLLIAATHDSEPVEILLPDGHKVCCLPVRAIEKVLARADSLYGGRPGWKREEGFDSPVVAVVSGTNRWAPIGEDGSAAHLREASLGGVLIDPLGNGREGVGNGEWLWSQQLHGAYARHIANGGQPGTLPEELPEEADLPALFPNRATTKGELARLRAIFGLWVRPFAAYSTAHYAGGKPAAVALGHVEPARWAEDDWRNVDGERVELVTDVPDRATFERCFAEGRPLPITVLTVRGYFYSWLREARKPGLREPALTVADVAEAVPVGKLNDWAVYRPGLVADGRENLLTMYKPRYQGASLPDLRAALAGLTASRLAEVAGIAERTARAILAGRPPSKATLEKLAPLLGKLAPEPARGCLGCGAVLIGRQRSFCSTCRKSGSERARHYRKVEA